MMKLHALVTTLLMSCWLFTKLRDAKSVKGSSSVGTVSESFALQFIGKGKRGRKELN